VATVTVDGVRIAYTDTGGPDDPVLLMHAFPFSSGMWEPQIEALGDRHRFIALDFMGFGKSEAPVSPSIYSMDAYAIQSEAVLDACNAERAVVCGLSMGGYVSFALLRRNPSRVRALVLADTRADADSPEVKQRRTDQQAQVASEGIDGVADALISGPLLSDATRSGNPDVVAQAQQLAENPAAGYIGALEAMKNRPDSSAELATINIPTLIIVGEHDPITPPEIARRMHEHIGGSQLVVVPGAAHLSNIEGPSAFNGALDQWLRET
jgi:3-oxoadipate enol-lactonase